MSLPERRQDSFMLEWLVQGLLCGLNDASVLLRAAKELHLADLEAVPYAVEQVDR